MTDEQINKIMELRMLGAGYGKIAQTLDISVNTVKSFCRRHNTEKCIKEEQAKVSETTQCENCKRPIQQMTKRKKKRFCCDACRNTWWNSHLELVKRKAIYEIRCLNCGNIFQVYGDRRRKYCCHDCYVEARFKGGACHD